MDNNPFNIKNYEEFALDFLEGNLSEKDEVQFMAFLENHPDIQAEMDGLMDYRLERPALQFEDKKALYKNNTTRLPRLGILSIAASIVLIAVSIFIFSDRSTPTDIAGTDARDDSIERQLNDRDEKAVKGRTPINQPETDPNLIAEGSDAKNDIKIADKAAEEENNSSSPEKQTESVDLYVHTETKQLELKDDPSSVATDEIPVAENRTDAVVNPIDTKGNEEIKVIAQEEQLRLDNSSDHGVVKMLPIDEDKKEIAVNISPSNEQFSEDLSERIPEITIPEHDEDEVIYASNDDNSRKKKNKFFKLKDLIPEQFAGLTRDEVKESLIPEVLSAR